MDLSVTRDLLEKRLKDLTEEEDKINQDLQYHFLQLIGKGGPNNNNNNNAQSTSSNNTTNSSNKASIITSNSSLPYENFNLFNDLQKVKNFGPIYESVEQNTKKLSTQIEECNALSERLSQIVRKLDLKQARAQKALACTEDILNLKECKHKILQAIEEKDLAAAVNCLRQVHEINEKAAKTSEDYEIIVEKEKEVKEMVRNEFQTAITESNTNSVMALCPLLQTLGLEAEARDNFLSYMESKVFIAVSADAAAVEGATDPSTAYAQALSNVFNSTCLIIQQYLPMVIQGLENSLGDVHFIRRLHKRCEQEAGLVLKRYMKYRGVKEIVNNLVHPSTSIALTSPSANAVPTASPADMHIIMNELALLIQYCCKYLKYLRNVCQGAENKIRTTPHNNLSSSMTTAGSANHNNSVTTTAPIIVFSGPLEFDKMIDELINKYYMEGEQWLMKNGIFNVLPKAIDHFNPIGKTMKLDECFFVLQKCGLRSIASNNVHAACACLTFISDLISNDLLNQGMEMLLSAINKLANMIQEYIQRYRKRMMASSSSSSSSGGAEETNDHNSGFISKGLSSAMSLASTIAGGTTNANESSNNGGSVNTEDIIFHEDGTFTIPSLLPKSNDHTDDRWGVASFLEAFNVLELCIRYTERLNKDLYSASQNVFMTEEDELAEQQHHALSLASSSGTIKYPTGQKYGKATTGTTAGGGGGKSLTPNRVPTEFDRIKLCKENFDNIKISYSNALRQSAERFVTMLQSVIKDILTFTLTKQGVYGGLKLDEKDETAFEKQPILILFPKILTIPVETMIQMSTYLLSEKNKDMMIHLIADLTCERIEQLIYQTRFSLSGALKMEELIRTLNTMFSRHSSIPVRGKFSRLREILMVLTSERLSDILHNDSSGSGTGSGSGASSSNSSNNFTHLLNHEIEAIYQLRVDGNMK